MRTGTAAVTWARAVHSFRTGYCLIFSRSAFGVASRYGTAALAWRMAQHKHTSWPPPAGVPAFWTGGSHGYGHITVSLGGGYCRSTDWPRRGQVNTARITDITRAWNLHYAGWSSDLNGVTVYHDAGSDSGVVDNTVRLANLKPKMRNNDVKALQKALRAHGLSDHNPSGVTGYFGKETRKMVSLFQQSQGWSKDDADGIPGMATCAQLGLKVDW